MYTSLQSLQMKGAAGDPLPVVWPSLHARGTNLLRGQLCLICAGPGTGKSGFVLTYALKARVPTLYFSADSDAFTQQSRSLSILSKWPLKQTEAMVRANHTNGFTEALDLLPIRYIYEANPTLKDISVTLDAYRQLYGDPPVLIIVDNITNVITAASEEDPFSGLEMLMDELHKLARDTQAHVIGLHHVNGPWNDADKPIPLSGIKGQIGRVPELILTLHRRERQLLVSTVKNRSGKADPTGNTFVALDFDGDTMQISDQA